MSTTIETSRTISTVATQRSRVPFTDKTPELTGGAVQNLQSTVELSGGSYAPAPAAAPAPAPAAPQASGVLRFRDLSSQERQDAKNTLKQLSGQARLWVQDGRSLRRADPAEIKERLDQGQAITLVSRLGSESEQSSSAASSSYYHQRGFFAHGVDNSSSSDSSSSSQKVVYTTSQISSWDSLDFVDTDGRGVPGTPMLPPSGGRVTVSSSYESNWSRMTDERWGIFTEKDVASHDSSHHRVSTTLD